MKSLILKDLYNIGHNVKSMLLMLLFFALFFIPGSGAESYIFTSGILCSMMVITTFSFDENSKWIKYAMVMPVSKRDLVASKFIVLLIFSAIGAVAGLLIGIIGTVIVGKIDYGNWNGIVTLIASTLGSLVLAEVFGSVSIPLLFKFGAEKARILSLVAILVPIGICFVVYQLIRILGISVTDNMVLILLCCSPLLGAMWTYLMYRISYTIIKNKEVFY
ncbi:MAG TPA: ABC-2 transporter permease [Candidatus Pelethocola excrementipullorum]|nr:ABC-2 transporter permease [Candidatus Pelethocola excrementipullorum]